MGKLRLYPTFREDFKIVLVSVPTTQEYLDLGVYEDLTDAIERIGFKTVECESSKPPRFFGTNMDVMKVTFRTLADMMLFKAYIDSRYES